MPCSLFGEFIKAKMVGSLHHFVAGLRIMVGSMENGEADCILGKILSVARNIDLFGSILSRKQL